MTTFKSELKAVMHLIKSRMASHKADGCTCKPCTTTSPLPPTPVPIPIPIPTLNTIANNRPQLENEFNKEFSSAYHFST